MITFREASQVRHALKMQLSNYAWYVNSTVYFDSNEYAILVHVKKINDTTRRIIPQVLDFVNIKVELEN